MWKSRTSANSYSIWFLSIRNEPFRNIKFYFPVICNICHICKFNQLIKFRRVVCFVRSAKSESRSSSLSGILNSSPSSHSYDTTSSKNISNYSINHSGGYPLSSSPTSYYSSSSPYISDPYSSQSRNGAGTRYHQPMPNLSSKSQQDIYSTSKYGICFKQYRF